MYRTGWILAAAVTIIAGVYLIADGAIRYRNAHITAETRAMQQWCLSRPRVVDGRCDEVLADLYQSRGPGLWSVDTPAGSRQY